ncbi:MAG: hypothetical protein WBA93_08135 [Microcoleaceae cyanobacterium]
MVRYAFANAPYCRDTKVCINVVGWCVTLLLTHPTAVTQKFALM